MFKMEWMAIAGFIVLFITYVFNQKFLIYIFTSDDCFFYRSIFLLVLALLFTLAAIRKATLLYTTAATLFMLQFAYLIHSKGVDKSTQLYQQSLAATVKSISDFKTEWDVKWMEYKARK